MPPQKVLAFRSSEIDSDAIWANLGGNKSQSYFISFSMTRSCSLQKLLADLGVNVILVTTLAKHCSYIYNIDSYCFRIGTLNSPRGAKSFQGGANAPPKRNPAYSRLGYFRP